MALIHAPNFLQARSAICAPRLALKFWLDLHMYKALFPAGSLQAEMVDAAMLSLKRHTWYPTEELVVFALWDEDMTVQQHKTMAKKIVQVKPNDNYDWSSRKPHLPTIYLKDFN